MASLEDPGGAEPRPSSRGYGPAAAPRDRTLQVEPIGRSTSSGDFTQSQGYYLEEELWLRPGVTPKPRPSPPPAPFVNAVTRTYSRGASSLGSRSRPSDDDLESRSLECQLDSGSNDVFQSTDSQTNSGLLGGNGVANESAPTRSMRNGMATTVPQNMVRNDLNLSHQPTARRQPVRAGRGRKGSALKRLSMQKESFEIRCCRISVLLVTMQMALGTTITALGFYMETLTSSLTLRECSHWAGIPVSILIYFPNFGLFKG